MLALLAAFALFARVATHESGAPTPLPVQVAELVHWVLGASALGLVLGRLVLGPAADADAATLGLETRAFRPGDELGLFALVAPFVLVLLVLLLPL
ncbi:MAG: hypothetical protein H6828_14895 [Planctomycetes bacterium]|nr:hypothetical protein [Planctomycetota bacterium]